MYPVFRLWRALRQARRMGPLGTFETHVSRHRVTVFDIDPWMELNNGRTLTLYDLGRIPLYERVGLHKKLQDFGMYFTVAGVSVRYRARLQPYRTVEMRSRMLGWDDRFLYVDQSLWLKDGTCANQALIRAAIARRGKGIVPPAEAARLLGGSDETPDLPDWVVNWGQADATRPWPPEQV